MFHVCSTIKQIETKYALHGIHKRYKILNTGVSSKPLHSARSRMQVQTLGLEAATYCFHKMQLNNKRASELRYHISQRLPLEVGHRF